MDPNADTRGSDPALWAKRKLAEKYEPLTEKVEVAQAEAEKAAEQAAKEQAAKEQAAKDDPKNKDANKPQPPPPEITLDPEAAKMLEELKKELAQLPSQEQQNANAAQQLNEQLKAMANEAMNQQLIPPQLQRELQNLAEAFQQAAVSPLKELAAEMQKATQPKAKDPQLPQLEARGEQVQISLEALKAHMDALREAQ